ncbi:hypothetical protein MLD38_018841 [Melastoma candidum]|uniref:Uncharacterized protein n=1 Tax=Melastoma candidum TaxID=119954 RepID=A0ACB9QVM7_9MYRT|nr:hypothetical protein MLD38_018841 [Melastoma candidum]
MDKNNSASLFFRNQFLSWVLLGGFVGVWEEDSPFSFEWDKGRGDPIRTGPSLLGGGPFLFLGGLFTRSFFFGQLGGDGDGNGGNDSTTNQKPNQHYFVSGFWGLF